jgi:hypothetical protein
MSPDALNSLLSLCLGFALAGALASGYQALAQRPAGFGLLQDGVAPKTFAAVPFLVFAAPFIIMRNTLRGARIERRRFEFVMMATIIAGFWSLMSGTFFVMTLARRGSADLRLLASANSLCQCLRRTGDVHGDL